MITPEQKSNREKWIQALESGEYQQTRGVLHDGVGYCCLGVACKVLGYEPAVDEFGDHRYYFGESFTHLPEVAAARLGLVTLSPAAQTSDGGRVWLANLNDDGVSFTKIAALLRQQPDDWTG